MKDVNKLDMVIAVLLLIFFAFMTLSCAGTVICAIVWLNPVLALVMSFFVWWCGKYTYRMYKIVLYLFDIVK